MLKKKQPHGSPVAIQMMPSSIRCLLIATLVSLSCQRGWGLAASPPSHQEPIQHTAATCQEELNLDVARLEQSVSSGRVYQQLNFISQDQVQFLLQEIQQLEQQGRFVASGLSNTAKGRAQGFGQNDRSTCVVPWWKESLEADSSSDEVATINSVAPKLQQLRVALSQILQRNFLGDNLAHECYYSQSKVGSSLPRHLDERHEELKGAKGWLLPSRRSISWLIYLSDHGWDMEKNGGALTAYPQSQGTSATSTHDGNLLVGWLVKQQGPSQPVYLDSWFKVQSSPDVPHCILYIVDENGKVEYITRPWVTDGSESSVADFLKKATTTLFLHENYAAQFALVEDREAWEQGEIPAGSQAMHVSPLRGSLVLFDSVAVPHQVEVIKQGTRIALAGWFHEETQALPEGFYNEES